MQITLIDTFVSIDGATPKSRSLGGAEKAFVYFSEELATRGHEVTAISRRTSLCALTGLTWLPWDVPRPSETDVLIVFPRPTLLQEVDDFKHKILWLWGLASLLGKAVNQVLLEPYMSTIVHSGETHRRGRKPSHSFQ